MKVVHLILCLCVASLAFAVDDVELWRGCESLYCAYLYQNPPCGLSIKVTIAATGTKLFEAPYDLSVSNQVCTALGSCTYCMVLNNLTANTDGSVYPCLSLQQTCSGTTSTTQLGCVTKPNSLAQCFNAPGGCPNDCSSHGTCSSGTCSCDSGWYGSDCSLVAPIFNDCVSTGAYGDVCLILETAHCAITAKVYFKPFPNNILYNYTVAAPAFNKFFTTALCFPLEAGVASCTGCLAWKNFVLNTTYAGGCPTINGTCTGLPNYQLDYDCFADDNLVPACFGTCPDNCTYPNGNCVNGGCVCSSKYTGDSCETLNCVENCYHHGVCKLGGNGNPTCSCNDGWGGDICGTPLCVNDCNKNGYCSAPNNCTCDDFHTGPTCEAIKCREECKNGGTCDDGGNACKCASGWEGADCSQKVTPGGKSKGSKASTYVVIGVVVGLVVAGGGAAGAFFVWRWQKSKRSGVFTAFDDGLIQVPDSPDNDGESQ